MVIFSFERTISLDKKSGGDGAVDTPVPISNTEVKHRSGEDIRKDKIASRRAFYFIRLFYILLIKYQRVDRLILSLRRNYYEKSY